MNALVISTALVVAMSLGGATYAASPDNHAEHHPGTAAQAGASTSDMKQRFDQMQTMMSKAQSAAGPERMKLMQQHMQLMQEQMQAMNSMMGGMMSGGTMGSNQMSGGMMGSNSMMGQGTGQMQMRMDMMQRMMEQMLGQQNMMMKNLPAAPPPKSKQ